MNSHNLTAGKEILSYCAKCNLKLAHVIMSMKDSVTAHKVECKTCKSVHTFKSDKTKTVTKSSVGPKKVSRTPVEELWNTSMALNKNKQAKDYSIKNRFLLGELINHPSFGTGVVQTNLSNDRIEVLFQNDIKTLVHGK